MLFWRPSPVSFIRCLSSREAPLILENSDLVEVVVGLQCSQPESEKRLLPRNLCSYARKRSSYHCGSWLVSSLAI
jgi:hypothetical protein